MGMPLFMLATFMSTYSKQSYLSFWKCTPLLEGGYNHIASTLVLEKALQWDKIVGVGYSLAVLRLISELRNVRISSFAWLLVWKFCNGDMTEGIKKCVKNTTHCITMYPTTAWNTSRNCTIGSEYIITSFMNYV